MIISYYVVEDYVVLCGIRLFRIMSYHMFTFGIMS